MKIFESEAYKKAIGKIANRYIDKKGSILVTGASGLIGSCMVEILLAAGFDVFALDLKKERLAERFGIETERLHFIAQNICEPISAQNSFDYIIHAASFADPKSYALYPVETILVNVIGANNVLEYAKNHIRTRVLVTSTFEVYGRLDQDSYSEDDYGLLDYNSLRSCYPESKRTTEVLVRSYFDEYKVDGLIVRFSSIYGPTMLKNDSKAHAQFLFKGINKENIVLKSKGEQKRTYTYVMDAVDALLYVLFNGKSGEAYNIANGESIITIAELASKIADICGTKVVYDLPDELEKKGFSKPQNCVLKTDKLTALGWKPNYSIDNGLIETLQIMKETMK
jgi:UDP-glucuronate decarboxylase